MGRGERLWTRAHFASLFVVLAVLVWVCRGQWFFGDEWDFIVYRGLHHPLWSLWRPHNEHWSTVPILWYRGVFSVFGLRSYWPYMFGLFALHLVVMHCGWRLMRRAGVGPALATGLALVFGLYGAGSENLLWAFQVGFVGSLAAGMLVLLLVEGPSDGARAALVAAASCIALMFSGISVFLVGAVGLAALGRWGWRRAVLTTAPPAVVYLGWLTLQGHVGLEGDTSKFRGGLDDVPRYVWGGLTTTLGRPFHSDRVGEVLIVALVVSVAVHARAWWRASPQVLALAAAAPVMFAVISQGRGAIQDPRAPRYLYLAAGMLLPVVGLALQQAVKNVAPRVLVALAACVALALSGTGQLRTAAAIERTRELTLKGGILTSLSVASSQRTVSDRPDFTYAGDITVAQLEALRAEGKLPSAPATVADRAYAHLALQVGIIREPQVRLATTASAPLPAGATIERAGDCDRVDLRGLNAVITRTADEAVFSLRSQVAGRIVSFVPYKGGNAGGRVAEVHAGESVTFHDVLREPLIVQLPGVTKTCGIAWIRP